MSWLAARGSLPLSNGVFNGLQILQGAPVGGAVLHQLTLTNTGGAPSSVMARLGLAFVKGDVPAGQRLAVRVAGGSEVSFAAAAAVNTWADGSLRSTADGGLVLVDGSSIEPSGSRTYEVYSAPGAQPASGFDPFAWLAANGNDFTVAVTSRTGSSSGAKSDLTFSLKTAIQTTTRREIQCNVQRYVRIKAWQKLPGEEHLICEFHLDFWLDSNGQPVSIEFAPILSQHWWVNNPFGVTQTKERQSYGALVKYGATVLDTRVGLGHSYYCRWASLRPQNDAQHARKHWVLGPMPTLRVTYTVASLKRMMQAGYIPPFRLGGQLSNYPNTTYAPLGGNGQQTGIDSTGGSASRGVWTDPDARLIVSQSETAWRASRVMSQGGLSVCFHVRDHRSAAGVNGGTDAPNRLIPQSFRQTAALGLSQSYPGLGSHCVYTKLSFGTTTGLTQLVHNPPTGGSGAFTGSDDNSHAVNYCGPMAFLEGEAYLADAAISQFNAACFKSHFSEYGSDLGPMYSGTDRGTAQGVPTSVAAHWGTIPESNAQERCMGWAINLVQQAYALHPDSHPEQPFIKNMVRNYSGWMSASYDYFPASHRAKGGAFVRPYVAGVVSPWMLSFQGSSAYQAARLFDFLPINARGMNGFQETAHLSARWIIQHMSGRPYAATAYRSLWSTDLTAGMINVPADEYPSVITCSFSSSIGTATPLFGTHWTNGDKVRFSHHQDFGAQSLSGLSYGVLYYMVSVSGNTFRLATSPGGAPLTIGNGTVDLYISEQHFLSIPTIGSPFYQPSGDNQAINSHAVYELAIGNGHVDMTPAKRDAMRAAFGGYMAGVTDFATFNYDGDHLL